MLNFLATLAVRTVTEPRIVARELLGMQFERNTLWSALALAVVLNAIAYQLSLVLSPPPVTLPLIFTSPIIFTMFIGAGLVLSIFSTTHTGKVLGGKAKFGGLMTLIVWLQFLRFGVQILSFVLVMILPGLAGLIVLGATLYGMWILLQFIDVAHEFGNLFASFGTLMLSALAIMLGLAILLSLFGVQNMGLTPYV